MTTCMDHNDGPGDYAAWHAWAEQKAKTHTQSRCDECGLWAIWTPKLNANLSAAPPDPESETP